jgi:hypothetical protein
MIHYNNRSSSSNSSRNELPNIDNNTSDRHARLVNTRRRTRPSKIIERSNVLVPILSKAGHRYAITIEDILTDSCAAKHQFEYLGIVRIDTITGNDVHWSKCNKCGLDKFKATPSPRYDGIAVR